MAIFSEVISALAYAGVGAGLGTVGAAAIASRSGKAQSRAEATSLLTNSAVGFSERVSAHNIELTKENREAREALINITDAMDLVLDAMDTLLKQVVVNGGRDAIQMAITTARVANRTAKLVL